MKRVAVFIQARMGSTRLPGKVMLPLGDKPVLAHVIGRCRAAAVGEVVVATTRAREDDVIVAAAARSGAASFRGSGPDVLGRFAAASRAFPAAHYVRITADCPFLDAAILAAVVNAHVAGGFDFSYNDVPGDYPRGTDVEVMTAATLAWLDAHAGDESSREHVTAYIYRAPAGFACYRLPPPGPLPAGLRLVLDDRADYERLQRLTARFADRPLFGLADVTALAAAEPGLFALGDAGSPPAAP
jgi:spore coat polysaccharide biosynthesis protein SpsF